MSTTKVKIGLISDRLTESVLITGLSGSVNFDCSSGSVFNLDGDITAAYTIKLINYTKGQIITIYPVSGDFALNLDAGTGTSIFYKLAEADYDGTADNIIQIECVDDDAANPVFFYSIATYASGKTGI